MISFSVLACVTLIISIIIPTELQNQYTWRSNLIISVASIGKIFVAASFSSVFVYTIRMFPTRVRTTFFAICCSSGRIGSLISPQLNLLKYYTWIYAPNVLFVIITTTTALALVILPDSDKFDFNQ